MCPLFFSFIHHHHVGSLIGQVNKKGRREREIPVPKTHLERIGLAVSGGREVEDTPLGEPGDGVYSVS